MISVEPAGSGLALLFCHVRTPMNRDPKKNTIYWDVFFALLRASPSQQQRKIVSSCPRSYALSRAPPLVTVPSRARLLLSALASRCKINQEEQDYAFHSWALGNGIECGGGQATAEGEVDGEGPEEFSFDDDDDDDDDEYEYEGGDSGAEVISTRFLEGWHQALHTRQLFSRFSDVVSRGVAGDASIGCPRSACFSLLDL